MKVKDGEPLGRRVLSEKTSMQMRRVMRLVVTSGTGRKAEVPGYLIGGKTGTADKMEGRGYAKSSRIASFASAFPMNDPRYTVLVIIDEPKGTKKTFGYATGGWVAAPAVGRIVGRMGPLVGIAPDMNVVFDVPEIEEKKPKIRKAKAAPKRDKFIKKATWVKKQTPKRPADDDEFTRNMRAVLEQGLAPQ